MRSISLALLACAAALPACVSPATDSSSDLASVAADLEAVDEAAGADLALGGAVDLPVFKRITVPNVFGIPGHETLTVPVYRSAGRLGPGILLVHGNSSSSRSYARQVFGVLGRRMKIFLVDLPGFGNADKVDASRPLPLGPGGVPQGFPEYQVGMLAALAATAADPEIAPEVFVGWSLGGDLLLLARGAGLLPAAKGFFIFGTAPTGASAPAGLGPFLPPDVPGLPLGVLASFGLAFEADPASPIGFNLEGSFGDPVPAYAPPPVSDAPTIGEAYVRAFFKRSTRASGHVPAFVREDAFVRADARARGSIGAAALGLLPPGSLPDELDVLRSLAGDPSDPSDDVPIAVVVGAEDAFVNAPYLDALAGGGGLPTLWRDEVIRVSGAGHAVHLERPLAFDRLLLEFVRGQVPGS